MQQSFTTSNDLIPVRFGPVATNFQELFSQGWYLETAFPHYKAKHNLKVPIRIRKDNESYVIGRARLSEVQGTDNLLSLVRIKRNLWKWHDQGHLASPEECFSALLKFYPKRKAKTPILIGNQTVKEYVSKSLR